MLPDKHAYRNPKGAEYTSINTKGLVNGYWFMVMFEVSFLTVMAADSMPLFLSSHLINSRREDGPKTFILLGGAIQLLLRPNLPANHPPRSRRDFKRNS